MPTVPIYEQSVPVEAQGAPRLALEPMTPASSPAGVAEASAKIGDAVSSLGERLEQHMVTARKIEAQSEVYDRLQKYNAALQDKAYSQQQNGFLTRQGKNAYGAVTEFDKLTQGVPGAPGMPRQEPLKAQFMDGLSSYQLKMFERGADSHTTVMREAVIKHEVQQRNAAAEGSWKDYLTNTVRLGASVQGVKALTDAQDAVRQAFAQSTYWNSQGHPEDVTKSVVQEHIDETVKLAVESNASKDWNLAQNLLNASAASPAAKIGLQHAIDGARTGQYAEALEKKIIGDPAFRTEGGKIDEGKAIQFAVARIGEQEKSGTPLPPGHFDTLLEKVRSQVSMQNQAVNQRQELRINQAGNEIQGAFNAGTDPRLAYDKIIKQGQFDNAIERGKAEDLFKRVYSHDPTALDAVWEHMTQTQKDAIQQVRDSQEIRKVGNPASQKQFIDSLRQQIIEKRVMSRSGINDLFQENLKKAPTGAPPLLGLIPRRDQPFYKVAEELQKNQSLVSAVGGTQAAADLAKRIGGPKLLAPDTPESKAVMALLSRGVKPQQILRDSLKAVIDKHPEWLK